jgi:hypothetical protein
VALLDAVAAPLTTALRGAVARSITPLVAAAGDSGPVVLLLAPDLQVRVQTEATARYLRLLVPPGNDGTPVPAAPTTSPRSCSPSRRASMTAAFSAHAPDGRPLGDLSAPPASARRNPRSGGTLR